MAYKRAINSIYIAYKEKYIEDNYSYAEHLNRKIEHEKSIIENLLKNTELESFEPEEYYTSLLKKSDIEEYIPSKMESEKSIKKRVGYKNENKLLEKIKPSLKEKRIEINNRFQIEYEKVLKEYMEKEKENKKKYHECVDNINKQTREYNVEIEKRKNSFLRGEKEEVEKVFDLLELKSKILLVKSIIFNYDNRKATVDMRFINPETELDKVKYVKYIKSRDEIQEYEYNRREFEIIYEKIVLIQY